MIGFADISALLSYTGVSIGLLIERYNHQMPYRVVLTNEEDDEEVFELHADGEDSEEAEIKDHFEADPFFSRIIRSICRSCIPFLDSNFSPKTSAIVLLLIFIPTTSLLAILVIHPFLDNHLLSRILILLCILINLIIIFLFCLLRPKKHGQTLLFTCPGIPLIPLININIFIFLMVFQDVHDWFAYTCMIFISLLIYFAYSYWHSKSR